MSLFCASVQPLLSLFKKAPTSSPTLYKGVSSEGGTFFSRRKQFPIVSVHRNLESRKGIKVQENEHVPVQVANEHLTGGYRYLDVRSVEEYNAGHVEGSINIPYLVNWGGCMRKNYSFLDEVEARFGKNDEIVVGCKTGEVLSRMVAIELVAANFTKVTTLGGGEVASENNGLPSVTNQKIGR